jgi:hypothetical protein
MTTKRDAALVRHYAAQLGLTVNEYTKGRAQHFIFLRQRANGYLEPAGVNLADYDIVGVNAALAWLSGFAIATHYRAQGG